MPPPDARFEQYQAALQRGHDQLRQGKLKQALAEYRSAAQIGQSRALPHVSAAGVLIRMGKVKDALAEYDRALAVDGDDRAAVAGKAATLRAAGKVADAAPLEARLAELDEEAEAQRLATAVAGAGGRDSAEGLLVAAERLSGMGRRDAAINAWLGASERYSAAGQLDAALDTCLRALLADSGSARVHLELSRLYFLCGWHQRGAEHLLLLDKLLRLEPDAEVRDAVTELAGRYRNTDARLSGLSAV